MNVNLNKKSVKQDGGPSHQMSDGTTMPGATHGESMAPPQQEVDPAIQEIGQYFAQSVQQGSKPEEVIMTLLEQQVDQNIIAQALMMVGYEENELQQLFQTVQELSQPQQASGPEVTRDPQELARNEAIAAEQEGLDVAVEEVDIAKSGIEIKPENKGKFTAWAKARGMSVKEAYTKVMANTDAYPPRIVKMANFAKNAAGFKKQDGGGMDYTEGVRQREGSYNAPNRKYTLDPRFKQEGGEQTPEMIEYLKALEFNKKARQAVGTNDKELLASFTSRIKRDTPYGERELARDFSELQKLRQAAGLGLTEEASILLPHVGQQLRGGFNQILGTNFEEGGEFQPRFMYKGKRKIRAKDIETQLRLEEAGYTDKEEIPKAQTGEEKTKAQLVNDEAQGVLRNELFFTPNVTTEGGLDLGRVANTLIGGYKDMFSGDNNNDGVADGSFRDWNKKLKNNIIADSTVTVNPDLSDKNMSAMQNWFDKYMEESGGDLAGAKSTFIKGVQNNPELVKNTSPLENIIDEDKINTIKNSINNIGTDLGRFIDPIVESAKGAAEDVNFKSIGDYFNNQNFQIGGESFTNAISGLTNYIEDNQLVADSKFQTTNPLLGPTPFQQANQQSNQNLSQQNNQSSNDLLGQVNTSGLIDVDKGGVGSFLERNLKQPAQAIGDVADFTVKGLGIANDYLEYGNAEDVDNFKRTQVYADNLMPTYTNANNKRGVTDINTGVTGSEADKVTGLFMNNNTMTAKNGGGVNNAGFKALPPEAQANILQNMQGGGTPGEQIDGMPTKEELDLLVYMNKYKNSFMADNYQPSQEEFDTMSQEDKEMYVESFPNNYKISSDTPSALDLYKLNYKNSFMANGSRPSQQEFDTMDQDTKEMYAKSFPGNYKISSDTPTREELNAITNMQRQMAYGGSKGEAAYLANRDAVIQSAMGKAQNGEELGDDKEEISVSAMSALRRRIAEMQERNRKEEERVARVRSRVPAEARKLDKADDPETLFGPEGTSGLEENSFYNSDYFWAQSPTQLKAAIRNLPQAIKDVLPDNGNYNLGLMGANKEGEFDPERLPSRELYCTPYGCFPYQEAGAYDLPTIGGNYTFVEDSKSEKLPFQKIDKSEKEIGDMQILYNQAATVYTDPSQGTSYRPHHTTIYNGKSDAEGGFGGWNAQGGTRLEFNEQYWKPEYNETPEYYRYVGNTRQNNRELKDLEYDFRNMSITSPAQLEMEGIQPLDVQPNNFNTPPLAEMLSRTKPAETKKKNFFGFQQGGETVNVDSTLLAKLIAAGADIEIL